MRGELTPSLAKTLAIVSEFERGFKVTPVFVRMAGHFGAGALLSQIVYWYLPDKEGNPTKLRHIGEDGFLWIAKKLYEWEAETGMDQDEVMSYLARLVNSGLVLKRVGMFGGTKSTFVRLDEEKFVKLFRQELANPSSRNAPKTKSGKPEMDDDQIRNTGNGRATKSGIPEMVGDQIRNTGIPLQVLQSSTTNGDIEGDAAALWDKVKEIVDQGVPGSPDIHFDKWLRPVKARGFENDVLVLSTPDSYAPAWLERISRRWVPTLHRVFGREVPWIVVVETK